MNSNKCLRQHAAGVAVAVVVVVVLNSSVTLALDSSVPAFCTEPSLVVAE